MIAEAGHAIALASKKFVSACISRLVLRFEVLAAVDLDHQLHCVGNEVDNVRPDWRLAPKAGSLKSVCAKRMPDDPFCRCQVATQRACE